MQIMHCQITGPYCVQPPVGGPGHWRLLVSLLGWASEGAVARYMSPALAVPAFPSKISPARRDTCT